MRAFTAAAIQLAPVPGPLSPESVRKNLDKCVDFTRRCVDATGAELVVLPESATTGFTPDCTTEELWDLVSEIPGPVTEPAPAGRERPWCVCRARHLRAWPRARRHLQLVGAHRPLRRGHRRLPQDPPVLHRARRRRRLGHPGRHGHGLRHRPRQDRDDHLLRRRLPRAVPDPGRAGRRGDRAAVGAAPVRRHLGADLAGPRLRQPRLRRSVPTPPGSTRPGCSTSATRTSSRPTPRSSPRPPRTRAGCPRCSTPPPRCRRSLRGPTSARASTTCATATST